jgi:hypothetical protein
MYRAYLIIVTIALITVITSQAKSQSTQEFIEFACPQDENSLVHRTEDKLG